MKKLFLSFLIIFVSLISVAQEATPNQEETDNYGWSRRISFIFGAGPSIITNSIYSDAVINKADNTVKLEKSGKLKTSLSLGIMFTPFVSDVKREVKTIENKNVETKTFYEHYPRGISFALFMNPIDISSINTTQSSAVDLGLGLGYRSGDFTFLLTTEFFSVRQPRDYFVNQYSNNATKYSIDGNIQSSIDLTDNTIYKGKMIAAIGFKLAYTFDIAKTFYSRSQAK